MSEPICETVLQSWRELERERLEYAAAWSEYAQDDDTMEDATIRRLRGMSPVESV